MTGHGPPMSRLLLCLAAALAAAPAGAATRNFGVSGFERIRVEGPFKVSLRTGTAPFARAEGDPRALDRVSMNVQGKTLIIRSSQAASGSSSSSSSGPVEIAVGTHDLTSAIVSGSGSLAIDKVKGLSFQAWSQGSGGLSIGEAEVDQLTVIVFGSASATLGGTAPKLTARLRGTSTLDAAGLTAKDATVSAEGPATARLTVTGSAKVIAKGASAVELAGRPACALTVTGSAAVSGCR